MHVVKLMALICAVIPFQSWSGDYRWTRLGDDGNGNGIYELDGTISLSDIDPNRLSDKCASGVSCGLILQSTLCAGNTNSTFNGVRGETDVDTPVTYLNKINWTVSGLRAQSCERGGGGSKIQLYLNAYKNSSGRTAVVYLASNDGSGGGVLPPPTPEPDPLKCSLTLRRDTLDWGTVPLGELNVNKFVGGYLATVSCSGGTGTATARLKITNMGGNSNIAEMKNDSGDVIPAKVILENENNTKTFTVRNGYDSVQDVFARIQSYNISTYGEYKGSALLTLELL